MNNTFFAAILFSLMTCFLGVANATTTPPTSFDFNYEIGGDEATVPVQVFDDGERTYFQFRDSLKLLPIIFRIGLDGQREQVPFERRAPYVVVNELSKRYYLANGVGQASIEYVGAGRASMPQKPLTIEAAVARVAAAIQPPTATPAIAAAAPPAPAFGTSTATPSTEARTIYRDIVFPRGANVIPRAGEEVIDQMASELREAIGLVVYARTDKGGALNLRDQRGAAIKKALVARGAKDALVTVIIDPEIREDSEGRGFASSVFVKLPPLRRPLPSIQPTPAIATLPAPSPAQVAAPSNGVDAASHPKVLAATADLLRQGLVTPEMATQILINLKDATPTEGYRVWDVKQSDRDLRAVLATWVRKAGWSELVWQARPCKAPDFTFAGTFEQALTKLSQAVGLNFSLYTGDRVLVVNDSSTGSCKG